MAPYLGALLNHRATWLIVILDNWHKVGSIITLAPFRSGVQGHDKVPFTTWYYFSLALHHEFIDMNTGHAVWGKGPIVLMITPLDPSLTIMRRLNQ